MSQGTEKRICHLGLVRGTTLSHRTFACHGTVHIDYRDGPIGHCSSSQETAHVNGRIFGEGKYEVFGRYSAKQPGPFETKPAKPIGGYPAAIAAKHGDGEVFLFSSHPEMPVSYQYRNILDRIARGDTSVDEAVRRCWNPPAVTRANMQLLRSLFRWLSRGEANPREGESPQPSAERAGLLSSAKELQKLRLMEIENSLLAHLDHAETPALQFAAQILRRRLRQARHFLNTLTADRLWHDPQELDTRSLVLFLQRFCDTGDLPWYPKKMRFDFQAAKAKRMKSMRGTQRQRLEYELAGLVVDRLDSLVMSLSKTPSGRHRAGKATSASGGVRATKA